MSLGYYIQRCVASEMFLGGVRVTSLVQDPPTLKISRSEDMKLPSLQEERAQTSIDHYVQEKMVPLNIPHAHHEGVYLLRYKDLYERHKNPPQFHPRVKDLTIAPSTDTSIKAGTGTYRTIRYYGPQKGAENPSERYRYVPLLTLKPVVPKYAYAARQTGLRSRTEEMKQERLDQRGFGWKKKSRELWELDINTKGHKPKRGY